MQTSSTTETTRPDRLDHGVLNLPLAKRGNIDAQIDRHKSEMARQSKRAATNSFHQTRAKKARVTQALAALSDERVMQLAAPLGSRKASTARVALASAASANLDRWLAALEREAARDAKAEGR